MEKLLRAGFLVLIMAFGGYAGAIAITQHSIGAILATILTLGLAVSFLLYTRPTKTKVE